MHFLNAGGRRLWNGKNDITEGRHRATVGAGEANGLKTPRSRPLERLQDIRRRPARRNTERNVSWRTERVDLPGKDIIERVVVAPCREQGLIGRQRDGRQGSPFRREPPDELGREVLSVG